MQSVKDEKPMPSNIVASGADEPEDEKPSRQLPAPARASKSSFFTIYKSGQGYWTRMGTVAGAALIAILMTGFLYEQIPVVLNPVLAPKTPATSEAMRQATTLAANISLASCAIFVIAFALVTFFLMNKPTNADFLIATDSEMKKVNWTSRKELIGSTKVVIGFMFMIAFLLFALDVCFGYLFYFLSVLKTPPF